MGHLVFAVYSFVIGILQLLNVSTVFTKGFSERIEGEILRRRYMRMCGIIRIVLAAMFVSMIWGERLLSTHWFVVLYLFLGALILTWQILTNRKYLGRSR